MNRVTIKDKTFEVSMTEAQIKQRVKELAQQMGGSIYVNSATGKGTTVWIVIPCKAIQTDKKLSTY